MFAPRPVDYYTSSLYRPSGPGCIDQLVALHDDLGSGRGLLVVLPHGAFLWLLQGVAAILS